MSRVVLPIICAIILPAVGCGGSSAVVSPSSHADSDNITGQVRVENGTVSGACVRFKGSAESTISADDGSFHLPRSGQRITAAKEGYRIAGVSIDTSPLLLTLQRLPTVDNQDYQWVDPTLDASRHSCANCHAEMVREWSASAHARSATGKHFRNLYDGSDWHDKQDVGWSLLRDRPDGAAVCASCHAPTMPLDGGDSDIRSVKDVAAFGVHCDYCHKIQDVASERFGRSHGRFNLKLLRPAEGQLFFGALDDVDRGDDAFAKIYRESRYCASCHEGIVFGVPVYTTYSEWLSSPARREGKQCQTCHMAPTGNMTNFAPGKGGIERDPKTLANHRFFAGSQDEMLRKALPVSIQLMPDTESVRVAVEIRADGIGHRAPTGFVDRHLILTVEARDGSGKVVAAKSGPLLPAVVGPTLAGHSGRLYAKLLKDFQGQSPAAFWNADTETTDTRLEPGQVDRLNFAFPFDTAKVSVRLLYRRFWQTVADEKRWPDNEITVFEKTLSVEKK
jgi:Cytochrome c554 and c-prime